MAGHSGPAAQEGQDQEVLKLTICLLILAFLIIALARMQEERTNALIGAIAYLHVVPFAELVRLVPALIDMPVLGPHFFRPMVQTHDFLHDGAFARMSPEARSLLMAYSARAAIVIYGPFLVWIALRGYDIRPDQLYRNAHTLESMIRLQTEDWVTARIARHVNPSRSGDIGARLIADAAHAKISAAMKREMPGLALPRKAISLSPDTWSRALRPEEWLVARGLVFDMHSYERLSSPDTLSQESDFNFRHEWEKLQLNSISEVLAQQLRTPWPVAGGMRPCHRALFAVMALFYDFDIKEGNNLLSSIALVNDAIRSRKGGMDAALRADSDIMARIDNIINGPRGKKLSLHADKHAWLETAFPTFLSVARKDRGVLPSAAFLWLKAEDRLLWYILNNVGNEAIMVEAAGAAAHWRAECQIGMRIRRPATFQAARAILEDYLDQTPGRIALRHTKTERRRTPAEQIRLSADDAAGRRRKPVDPDNINEE